MKYEFNLENGKEDFMAKVADLSGKVRQWISLQKRILNNPLEMEMASPYSNQDTIIRIWKQINIKRICFF